MKPEVKTIASDLRKLLPTADQALSTQTMKLDERVTAISQWRELTSPALITILLDRIDQLEKLWAEPTDAMAQAGLAEVQHILDEWSLNGTFIPDEVTDSMASDLAVFVLQAMAGKLPKEP